MSTTLTNGLKLPDKGSVDWYADMQSNYTILDGAVGTVAEHTTQIAGKASASHTHGNITNDGKVGTAANKPLITGTGGVVQAGAFGNQANTFCEGNDSRLSDARTPVAHTHTKSDVTDLFNTDNTWMGRQVYGAYLKSFGEARTDEWSTNSRTNAYLLSRRDTEDVSGFLINTFRANATQGTAGHIYGWDILENSTRYSGLRFAVDWDSTLNSGNGAYKVTLGTNTQGTNPCNDLHITQLKTINGINPGVLSLPAYDPANSSLLNYDPINTDGWNLTGSGNNVSITEDGYVYIGVNCGTDGYVVITEGQYGYPNCFYRATGTHIGGAASAILPVRKGIGITVYCKGTSVYIARFFPTQGNV